MTQPIDKVRAEFEALYKIWNGGHTYFKHPNGFYQNLKTYADWKLWQASRAAALWKLWQASRTAALNEQSPAVVQDEPVFDRITELEAQLAVAQKDAERYQWFVAYMISDRENLDDAFVACDTKEEFDSVIDKAIAGAAT